jgi:general secretion pathway protein G
MGQDIPIGDSNKVELRSRLQSRVQRSSPRRPHFAAFESGFTLIELMIVIMIIAILVGMAALKYDQVVKHSKEAVLRTDLRTLRDAIDNYTLDKQAAPQSVEDLQQAGYLREVPVDPITHAKDWVPQFDSVVLSPEQTSTGMTNVHSNSSQISTESTPYNEW